MRLPVVLLLLLSAGIAVAAEPAGATCAPLPVARPADLRIHLSRRGPEPSWLHQDLVPRGSPCPESSAQARQIDASLGSTRRCRAAAWRDVDALWARLRLLRLDRIIVRTLPGTSPHRGGFALSLAWGDGRCEISDLADQEVASPSAPSFLAAVQAVTQALDQGAPALETCIADEPPPPLLRSFTDARPETRHRISVAWDPGAQAWVPAPRLDMPHHHASRIEWENLAPYAVILGRSRVQRLVFTVMISGRDVRPPPPAVPGDRGVPQPYRATYRARIESVCLQGP